jgi:hypothetical protein
MLHWWVWREFLVQTGSPREPLISPFSFPAFWQAGSGGSEAGALIIFISWVAWKGLGKLAEGLTGLLTVKRAHCIGSKLVLLFGKLSLFPTAASWLCIGPHRCDVTQIFSCMSPNCASMDQAGSTPQQKWPGPSCLVTTQHSANLIPFKRNTNLSFGHLCFWENLLLMIWLDWHFLSFGNFHW